MGAEEKPMTHISVAVTEALEGIKKRAKDGSLRGRATVHGLAGTPEHQSWSAMCGRCNNPTDPAYARYGGRGIIVCTAWLGTTGFQAFLKDMGPRPVGTSLDRVDVNGNYEPSNCRWATRREQAQNKRNNVMITAFGKTQCLVEWARERMIPEDTLRGRIKKMKLDPEIALTMPLGKRAVPGREIVRQRPLKGGRHG